MSALGRTVKSYDLWDKYRIAYLHSNYLLFHLAHVSTPRPRSGVAAERSNPTSEERWVSGRRRAERSYSTFKVRRGGGEEIPLVQGKEQ